MVVNCEKPQLEEEKQAPRAVDPFSRQLIASCSSAADAGSTAERVQGVAGWAGPPCRNGLQFPVS